MQCSYRTKIYSATGASAYVFKFGQDVCLPSCPTQIFRAWFKQLQDPSQMAVQNNMAVTEKSNKYFDNTITAIKIKVGQYA
jgi:hypothetical protein